MNPLFSGTVSRAGATGQAKAPETLCAAKKAEGTKDPTFKNVLQSQLQEASGVKFSAHAMNRIDHRHIDINIDEAKKVGDAMKMAKEKGSRESLFIGANYALIVNVKNETVVTAMDKDQISGGVITNIDSTVII